MTPEQADHWFTYHAPTGETAPKYAAIRAAEDHAALVIKESTVEDGPLTRQDRYDEINEATRDFAVSIDANCPDGYDKDAAIRCVRLARNAANEAVTTVPPGRLVAMALTKLQEARWQANSAIACGGI